MNPQAVVRDIQASIERLHEQVETIPELRNEIMQLAQRVAGVPITTGHASAGHALADAIMRSDGFRAFNGKSTPSFQIDVPTSLISRNVTQVFSAVTNDGSQTLVQTDRGPEYIVTAPQRRLTIRALFTQIPTSSDAIERPSESTFTSGANFQGGTTSPTGRGELALKEESNVSFSLTKTVIQTIAHWITASRQILSDARLLQTHLERRLIYFLNLKEEGEFLTGSDQITGINQNATAFSGGATNQTRLDTLAKAANQLAVSDYSPSGFILHPTDWLNCQLEKDTQGRYILGDPAAMTLPMLWGLPVVPTPSQTQGTFTVLDAARYGWIADREEASVRISENVNDAFLRNQVHLLCEKRTALITELGAAAVTGSIATPG